MYRFTSDWRSPERQTGGSTQVSALQIPATEATSAFSARAQLWLAVSILLLLVTVLIGCGGEDGDAQRSDANAASNERLIRVETLVLQPTTFEDVIRVTGTVRALDDATLSAQSAGTVTTLAGLGTYVARGGTVAQLNPAMAQSAFAQAEAQVEAAQAAFDLAEDNLRRQEPLYRDSVISAIEWENVRANYNQARANLSQAEAGLSQAEEQLRQTRVAAPFGGRVEEHLVELGEQVTPGRTVARIINTDRVKIAAGVPERYAADIRVGTPVSVELQAYQGQPVQATVGFVGSAVNPDNRTFPIEIVINNQNAILKPEMVANVSVTRRQMEDVLVVPRAAVLRTEDGNIVYVVEQEPGRAVASRRDVVLGPSFGGDVVVTNLQPGDEVIVLGQTNLTEGDPVQVMEQYVSGDAIELDDETQRQTPDGTLPETP